MWLHRAAAAALATAEGVRSQQSGSWATANLTAVGSPFETKPWKPVSKRSNRLRMVVWSCNNIYKHTHTFMIYILCIHCNKLSQWVGRANPIQPGYNEMSNYHFLNENSQYFTHLTSKFPSLHPSCLHFPFCQQGFRTQEWCARAWHLVQHRTWGMTLIVGTDLPRMVWFPDSDHRLHGTKLCLRLIISTFSHYSFHGVSWFMLFLQDISFWVSIPSIIIPLGIPTAPSSPKAQNAAENDGRPRPQLGSKWVGSG